MYSLITAPTSEPISTDDAKEHLGVAHSDHDTMIDYCVADARFKFESDVPHIQLLPATWCLYLDDWPSWNSIHGANILIKKEPLTAISNIKYYAEDETDLTTWSSSNYETDLIGYPGRISFNSDADLPDLNEDKYNLVQVTFTCGYANAAAIPGDIIRALKLLIGHYYRIRQGVITGTQVNEIPLGYNQTVYNYMKNWL